MLLTPPIVQSLGVYAQSDEGENGDNGGSGRGRGRGRGRGGRDGDDNEEEEIAPAAIPAGAIEVRIVSDDAGGFVPAELTVDAGQTIAFVNAHSDEHTATGSGFDTGVIPSGSVATVTLETPGSFPYACQIHPEMTGTIAVRDASGTVPQAQAATAPAGGAGVSIANLAFSPAQLSVPAGTTVVWTNDDAVPHTVTATAGDFDSGIFDPGATFSWTFEEPGEFAYVCQLHPQMQGTISVTANGPATPAAAAQLSDALALAGTWFLELLPSDLSHFAPHTGLLLIQNDGTAQVDLALATAAPETSRSLESGYGTWIQDQNVLELSLVVMLMESGRFGGLVWIGATATLDEAENSLTGSFEFALTDPAENPSGSGSGELTGHLVRPANSRTTLPANSG